MTALRSDLGEWQQGYRGGQRAYDASGGQCTVVEAGGEALVSVSCGKTHPAGAVLPCRCRVTEKKLRVGSRDMILSRGVIGPMVAGVRS